MNVKSQIKWQIRKLLVDHYPKLIIDHEWPHLFGRRIDWDNPRDLNEKIQWLMCYSDTSEWTRLADKYLVREFVEERGLGHLLTKLYGVWDDAKAIDFNGLPEKFVLKCNHDSGSTFLVDKAKGFDKDYLIATLNQRLNRKFGYLNCEPYYNKIKPLVIAEELLEETNNDFSSTLVDYKFWAFDGKVECVWVYYNRTLDDVFANVYDLDWNCHPEYSVFNHDHKDGKGIVPRPQSLNEMVEAASELSKGFPQVRVDFFESNGKPYFGELTFSSNKGRMEAYIQDYLIQLGNKVQLPPKRCPIK
jgi:hypothetical protein